jgi:hypothetical protein
MAETHGAPGGGAHEGGGGAVDHELNFRGIFLFVAALTAVTLGVFALMWGLSFFMKRSLVKEDPAPPKLAAARETRVPPGPNLQTNPAADMAAFRAEEDAALAAWAWADKEKTEARVPAGRALEIVAARGLPPRPPMPPPTAPATEAGSKDAP